MWQIIMVMVLETIMVLVTVTLHQGVIIVTLTNLVIMVVMHQGVLPFKYKQIFKILEKKASGKLYGDNRQTSSFSSSASASSSSS